MHKVAAIYDIHGNLLALEAVLEDINREHVDCIIEGGDLAWGPDPAGVMKLLMGLPVDVRFTRGNADREVAGRYGVEQGLELWVAEINQWCADQLTPAQHEFLRFLPENVSLGIDGLGSVLFVHGSPRVMKRRFERIPLSQRFSRCWRVFWSQRLPADTRTFNLIGTSVTSESSILAALDCKVQLVVRVGHYLARRWSCAKHCTTCRQRPKEFAGQVSEWRRILPNTS